VQKLNAGGPIGGISLRTQDPDLAPVVEHTNGASPKKQGGKKGNPSDKKQGEKAAASSDSSTSTESAAEKEATASPAEWSQDQQKALEAALKKFPASLGVQRWDSISAAVSGKTKKDCVERYKFIVAQLRGKTGGK
jgi:hypothetical protein